MSTSVVPLTPTYHIRSPTGDKPWYLHRGKPTAKLHHAFHFGLTNEGREATKQGPTWPGGHGARPTPGRTLRAPGPLRSFIGESGVFWNFRILGSFLEFSEHIDFQ